MSTLQERGISMARDMVLAAAALDYLSRDPARWEAFLAWACAAAEAPPIADRDEAREASGNLAGMGRLVLNKVTG